MSTQTAGPRKHVTLHDFKRMKDAGEKIVVVTAYDATMARLFDALPGLVDLLPHLRGLLRQRHRTHDRKSD